MQIHVTADSSESFLPQIARKSGLSPIYHDQEERFDYPATQGSGAIRILPLGPGLQIEIVDFRLHERLENRFTVRYTSLRFSFFLFAEGLLKWTSGFGKNPRVEINNFIGRCSLCFYPEVSGVGVYASDKRHLQLNILVAPSRLAAMLDGYGSLPPELAKILEDSEQSGFFFPGRMIRPMNAAVSAIFNCPFQGPLQKLFLESKTLELIAFLVSQAVSNRSDTKPFLSETADFQDRILLAENILRHHLDDPPSLSSLARRVGLPHTTLNEGFRKKYGATVFGHLHRLRLEQARLLMATQGLNVTEASLAVGYDSLPSFSRAFARYFGAPPKTFATSGKEKL